MPLMPFPQTVYRLLALALSLCAGCALSPGPKKSADALATGQDSAASGSNVATTNTASEVSTPNGAGPSAAGPIGAAGTAQSTAGAAASNSSQAKVGAPSAPDPRVIDDVLAELAALGPVQPEAQKRLIDDLRKTDPAYWPMLVQTFRASLEYRRRSEQTSSEPPPPIAETSGDVQREIVQVTAHEPLDAAIRSQSEGNRTNDVTPAARQTPAGSVPVTPTADASKAQATAVVAEPVPVKNAPQGVWRQHLEAAITELDRHTREHPGEADSLANQVYLRLLDLAAGRREDALKPISGLPPGQQEYWAKQLFALSTYLDQGTLDPGRRAAEASLHLARAVTVLGEQGPLLVRNLAFCTHVHSYGVVERFELAEFRAEQQVLLYAEIENFKSEETAQGFHTSLEASYEILDRQGQRVAHDDLATTEENCQNHRRDFFVAYLIKLPKNIYEGGYKLNLTVEDKLGRKIGQSPIDFTIKQK